MSYIFSWCPSLKNIDLSSFDTKNVKDMSGMFLCCEFLENIKISSFYIQKMLLI